MCESSAYTMRGRTKEILMKDVVKAKVDGDKVTCTNIIGETKTVTGTLMEVNLIGHSLTIVTS